MKKRITAGRCAIPDARSFILPSNFNPFTFYNRIFLFLLVFNLTCHQGNAPGKAAAEPSGRDTLPESKQQPPMTVGSYIHADSLPPPETVPAVKNPGIFSAYPNRQPAGAPKRYPVPEQLTVITPGQDNIPLPKTVPAKGKVTPAGHPAPVPSLPLRFRDATTYNIQYLEIDQWKLSQNVYTILDDSRGYLWFGTSAGPIRYDGNTLLHYTQKEGFPFNQVWSMSEDSRGRIWFAHYGGGATCYDGENFIQYTTKEGLTEDWIRFIEEDHKGNIWIGTILSGVSCFDGTHFTHYTEREGLSSDTIYSFGKDSRNNLWFGTVRSGVCRFDGRSFTHFTKKEGLSGNIVYCIFEDNRGDMWFGTGNGVSRFDGTSFYNLTPKEGLIGPMVYKIIQDRQGRIWIASTDRGSAIRSGLSCYDGNTWTHFTEKEGLSHNKIWTLKEDTRGYIWAGTANGATRLDPTGFVNFSEQNGLQYNHTVNSFAEAPQGGLWIGTYGGGLSHFDGECFLNFTSQNDLQSNYINSIIQGRDAHLWFDYGGSGLTRFDGLVFTHYTPDDRLQLEIPLYKDKQDNLWLGTGKGAARYDGKGFLNYAISDSLSESPIFATSETLISAVVEDRRGHFWFGTTGAGCIRYDGRDFTLFTDQNGLSANYINCLFEDGQGNLWMGTKDGGITCYDGTRFTHFSEKEGLGSNEVFGIAEDKKGNIWMSRYNGLSLLVRDSLFPEDLAKATGGYQIYNFDQRDGLKGKNFIRIYPDQQNRIWVGSEEGMGLLDLNQFELPASPPVIRLTQIAIQQQFIDYRRLTDTAYQRLVPVAKQLAGKTQPVAAFQNYPLNLKLPHHLNHLTFHFAATDWASPNKIQYSYYIKNIDKDWSIPQTEPWAEYRSLPSGAHTFRVRARGTAPVWSAPFEYTFTIRPPWYRAWWAYLLYALAIGSALYAIRGYELQRQLAKAEARRLLELDSVKTRLYNNITHEFRTPLTVILGMEEQVRKDPGAWLDTGLQLIRRNGKQLLQLVNQLLDLSKLESGHLPVRLVQGDIAGYLHYLTEAFHSYAESKDIQLHFRTGFPELRMDYDPEKLQNVMSNLLSNAIKFTPAGGDVYVELETTVEGEEWKAERLPSTGHPPAFIYIRVSDTGPGIEPKHLPHIFDRFYQADDTLTRRSEGTGIGLALVKEMVRIMGGQVSVSNAEHSGGKGARFIIRLPVTRTATELAVESRPDQDETLSGTVFLKPVTAVEASVSTPGDRNTVLLVEDNPDVIHYLSSVLYAHYRILTAGNGQEGIDKAIELTPDIIVSDVMMPVKDGFELCRVLKTDERTSHIPIILLTARTDQQARMEGLSQGADVYLAKPFHQEELLVRLEKLIDLRRRLQERFQKAGEIRRILVEKNQNPEDVFLKKVVRIIEARMSDEQFDMPQLCKALNMSRSNLFRKIKALTGKSVTGLIRSLRLEKAMELLKTTDMNVTEVCFEVGFNSPNYFSRVFQEAFGVAPSAFRKR